MKVILTIVFIFFIGTSATAQVNTQAQKAATYSAGVVLDIEIKKDSTSNDQVVRLYKFKNARVKKALSFKTKRNASKIA